jgi:hypothetical protein
MLPVATGKMNMILNANSAVVEISEESFGG